MKPKRTSRSRKYLELAMAFSLPQNGAPCDLLLAYTRLFLGPGQPIIHPYESVHIEGQLMGAVTAQVERCYAEAGLQLNNSTDSLTAGCGLPDHVSIELAFMAHLAAQEELDQDGAEIWFERQRRFLIEHLARWLPKFFETVEASQVHPFYCEKARVGRRFIEEELDAIFRIRRDAQANSPTADTHATRSKRYPNVSLSVNYSKCTLCSLCADNCRCDALTVDCTLETLGLVFDPSLCNGCRICLRMCPEDAITIEICPPLNSPASTPKVTLIKAPRVVCPRCDIPHIAEPWLERLVEILGSGEATRASLALCPFCKVILEEPTQYKLDYRRSR